MSLKAWLRDIYRDQRPCWAAFLPLVLLGWGECWAICKINSTAFLSTQFCADKYKDMESIREASSIFNNAFSPSLNYFENICWRKRCSREELRSQMVQSLCWPHFTPGEEAGTSQGAGLRALRRQRWDRISAPQYEMDPALAVMGRQVTPLEL